MRSWPRNLWGLNTDERAELKAMVAQLGDPPALAGALHPMRALRPPGSDYDGMSEHMQQFALKEYVTAIDRNLALALRSFMPDELWALLRAIEAADTGPSPSRVTVLNEGREEYRTLATEAVDAWRDVRRGRVRVLAMAEKRGLRGWDAPLQRRYLNSAPLESEYRTALMTVETSLLSYAGQRVALWLSACERADRVARSKRRGTTMRREVVALLGAAGLGYQRIVSLATSPLWRRAPCPRFAGPRGRERLLTILKADRQRVPRGTAQWSAAIEH